MTRLSERGTRILAEVSADFTEALTEIDVPILVMVHGGAPDGSPDVRDTTQDGLKPKRVQIRDRINSDLDFADAFFAEDGLPSGVPAAPGEQELFRQADATIILIELDAKRPSAQHELTMHASEVGYTAKVCALVPPHLHRFLRDDSNGFWADIARSLPVNSRIAYSADEYQECRLVEQALTWVEDRHDRIVGAKWDQFHESRRSAPRSS